MKMTKRVALPRSRNSQSSTDKAKSNDRKGKSLWTEYPNGKRRRRAVQAVTDGGHEPREPLPFNGASVLVVDKGAGERLCLSNKNAGYPSSQMFEISLPQVEKILEMKGTSVIEKQPVQDMGSISSTRSQEISSLEICNQIDSSQQDLDSGFFLLPQDFVLEQCLQTFKQDQQDFESPEDVCDLSSLFSELCLRPKAVSNSQANKLNLEAEATLFKVISFVLHLSLEELSSRIDYFQEHEPQKLDAILFFRQELTDILRLLKCQGITCFEIMNEVLAVWRRCEDESSLSDFCKLRYKLACMLSQQLDSALYKFTNRSLSQMLSLGSQVKVYDPAKHRWWIGYLVQHDHGEGALIKPDSRFYNGLKIPSLPFRGKAPSFFLSLFDSDTEAFITKAEDDEPHDVDTACVKPNSDHQISKPQEQENDLTSIRLENLRNELAKPVNQMRYFQSVCKGFPVHGNRGSSWSGANFEDPKHSRKLKMHVKYGRFATLILKKHRNSSPDAFDRVMEAAWTLPESELPGIKWRSKKEIFKLQVFAKMLSLNFRGVYNERRQNSKLRADRGMCSLCTAEITFQDAGKSDLEIGVDCMKCKNAFCMNCVEKNAELSMPKVLPAKEWMCWKCGEKNEECFTCGDSGFLLVCDGCNRDFCLPCSSLSPDAIPEGDWYCKACTELRKVIGSRVRVQCSDGEKYDGVVSCWDRKVSEYKIVLDCGEVLHSPLDKESWDVQFIGQDKAPSDPNKVQSELEDVLAL